MSKNLWDFGNDALQFEWDVPKFELQGVRSTMERCPGLEENRMSQNESAIQNNSYKYTYIYKDNV